MSDEIEDAYSNGLEDPFKLKSAGIEAYKAGEYEVAISLWRLGLKNSLKLSVRTPSRELFEVGLDLRLNLAAAHAKRDEWVDVLAQTDVVVEHRAANAKVQWRRACAYRNLGRWSEAEDALAAVIKGDPNNAAAVSLGREIEIEKLKAKQNEDKTLKSLFKAANQIRDERTEVDCDRDEINGIKLEDLKSSDVIQWEGGDVDDPTNPDSVWSRGMHPEEARPTALPFLLSLPLTVLHSLERLIDPTTVMSQLEHWDSLPKGCERLWDDCEQNHVQPLVPAERRALIEVMTRRSNSSDGTRRVRRPTTIHVVGVRGDVEMQAMWTAILQRLPEMDVLQVVMIGFLDEDDVWGRKLAKNVMSPPLTKTAQCRAHQKLICYLYRGTYQDFVKTYSSCSSFPPKDRDSSVLWDKKHSFHPDVICIPEPLLNKHFDGWIPVLSVLMEIEKPVIITGYSAIGVYTNEARNIPSILNTMNCRWLFGICPNPFRAMVKLTSDDPTLVHFDGHDYDGTPLWAETKVGASGKHAIVAAFMGQSSALKYYTPMDVSPLKIMLRADGVDVDSQESLGPVMVGTLPQDAEARAAILKQKLEESLSGVSRGTQTHAN